MFKHSSMLDFDNDGPAVVSITYVIGHDFCLLRHVNQNEKFQNMEDMLLLVPVSRHHCYLEHAVIW